LQSGRERAMEEKRNFDERYHASYAAKLKTIPLDKVEKAVAKVIGELTQDHVECVITNFNAAGQYAEITIVLDIGKDKRYSK
jgi:ATP-dependent RNA circularization protein (DNA/RNA ligase family)